MTVALARELTEDNLAEALCEERAAATKTGKLVVVVGRRAMLSAQRIIHSPGGPLFQIAPIAVDPKAEPDHWSLIRVPRRKTHRRKAA